ncbi:MULTISPECIES: glutaredoxin family protein [unclassified Arthrobacter]|uniref:glutaredoxin family protein n=1 Tax=unclassified Arthrobacter TaxID=235627 RepID=UPI001E58DE34|nr:MULTISPECIES: glutaredoxin family protein [unclassified Arthrobacter]MCC9144737.1 glutaredoxin family protein [Arthrobacter sp. zg-Y919]MDK1275963.1 glutaredoxin family protein [Arthrobacter sp. zg.Y919]MDM7990176.1 glutaredoxin family protein [Arthrobacter sp. zg-Y877]WIB02685.1 glutaredoxin family protein [Arthrobacter sp. zg-Y919]
MSESAGPEVVLLTRQGCHLCEDARLVLNRVGEELGMVWQERSAEDHPDLAARFGEEIPVLFIDGVQRDFWTIDETRLRRLLGA